MADWLASILEAIYRLLGSYGWAIILFTFIVKLALSPLDYKSRKSMQQMERIQPQLAELQKKYGNDKEKLNKKTMALYQKEKVSPTAGCLPMIFSMVILFIMFSAMRQVSNLHMAEQSLIYLADGTFVNEGFLWIRNLWMPDSPFFSAMPTAQQLAQIPAESWAEAYAALTSAQLASLPTEIAFDFSAEGCAATVEAIAAYMRAQPEYLEAIQTYPQLTNIRVFFFNFSVYKKANGWLILPTLSFATQIMTTKITQRKNTNQVQTQTNQTGKMMTWMMPLFSLFITISYNSSFALYWVASNLFSIVQTLVINRMLKKKQQVSSAA